MAIQGIIKSMPEYPSHNRAGVTFPRAGREFAVVDEKAMQEAAPAARALFDERRMENPERAESPDKPVVYQVAEKSQFGGEDRIVTKQGRLIDMPGKPLLMDSMAYEYFKQVFGTLLHCEPLGGDADPMAAQQKIQALEHEVARLKAELGKKGK